MDRVGVSVLRPTPRYPLIHHPLKTHSKSSAMTAGLTMESCPQSRRDKKTCDGEPACRSDDDVGTMEDSSGRSGSGMVTQEVVKDKSSVTTSVASSHYQVGPISMRYMSHPLPVVAGIPGLPLFPLRVPGKKKVFQCPHCRYVTDRKNNLKRHIGTMHSDCGKNLECCDLRFRSKASLRDHIYLFHRSGYRCKFCSRNFVRKALLKRHLSVHVGQTESLHMFEPGWPRLRTEDFAHVARHNILASRGHILGQQPEEGTLQNTSPVSTKEKREEPVSCQKHISPEKISRNTVAARDTGNIDSSSKDKDDQSASSEDLPIDLSPQRPILKFWSSFFASRLLQTHRVANSLHSDIVYDKLREFEHEHQGEMTGASASDQGGMHSPTTKKRLCQNPYKCSCCSACFSRQVSLGEHAGGQCGRQGHRQQPVLPLKLLVKSDKM